MASAVIVSLTSCATVPLVMETPKPGTYDEVGQGVASAGGVLLLDLIPLGINSRYERAYKAAIASKGGDAIINPTVSESRWWGGGNYDWHEDDYLWHGGEEEISSGFHKRRRGYLRRC